MKKIDVNKIFLEHSKVQKEIIDLFNKKESTKIEVEE